MRLCYNTKIIDDVTEIPIIFQGTLKKIRIVSNNTCYEPMPAPEDLYRYASNPEVGSTAG